MTRVALLWHMHQPYYEDLVTREHILPWVRLHALKDYWGMAALLREFPSVRMTFNLVPSLLVQLEAFASSRAHDRYLELGMKPAADLSDEEAAFVVENFFHAQRQRMIGIYPRYAELLERRGEKARRFTADELRDLQVWQKLAWIDPAYLDGDPRVGALLAKGRDFSEEDKAGLRAVELELLNAVIPEYREAAARGQVELSTSPYYHPILPLLCDTDVYRRTHPSTRLPRRFAHPEDALEQLRRARSCFERLFGHPPAGLWPSEGSVSDQMVPLVAEAGFTWMATDELILARTLDITFTRDGHEQVEQPERLYTPYAIQTGGARVACLFRDHKLSDLIGFNYAGWAAHAAADDFVARLVEAGRRYRAATGGGDAVVPIILDGENAWEHFEGGGRPFLRALYQRLSNHPELTTVTMAEAARAGGPELPSIFPGSWIDANYSIWIGHADDQRAWDQLGDARDALTAAAATADPSVLARAREELFVAEGSDWCWWYGDDHSSSHDLEFDDLYRRHLRNVYRLLQRPVPDELFVSNITAGVRPPVEAAPTALLAPLIDGEEGSYFEWLGAGRVESREAAGAMGTMHRADARPPLVTLVQFGFGAGHLYVRLDGARPIHELLAEGCQISLAFFEPEGVRVDLRLSAEGGELLAALLRRNSESDPAWTRSHGPKLRAAAGSVLELAVPLDDLGAGGPTISFVVAVSDSDQREVERHPALRPVQVAIPDAWFEARNWTA